MMGPLMCTGGGILIGVGLVWAEATRSAEQRAKKRFEDQLEVHKRALNHTLPKYVSYGPFDTGLDNPTAEEDLPDTSEDAITVGGEMIVESPIAPPEYLAAAATYGERENFLNDEKLKIAYIDEEEYDEADGREKSAVLIFMDSEGGARFTVDGQEIDNWRDLVGEHILVDLYKAGIGQTEQPILYVRNNQEDVDFEVSQVIP